MKSNDPLIEKFDLLQDQMSRKANARVVALNEGDTALLRELRHAISRAMESEHPNPHGCDYWCEMCNTNGRFNWQPIEHAEDCVGEPALKLIDRLLGEEDDDD